MLKIKTNLQNFMKKIKNIWSYQKDNKLFKTYISLKKQFQKNETNNMTFIFFKIYE